MTSIDILVTANESQIQEVLRKLDSIQLRITDDVDELKVETIIERKLNMMKTISEALQRIVDGVRPGGAGEGYFNYKKSKDVLPNIFKDSNEMTFKEYSHGIECWASVIHPIAHEEIKKVEAITGVFDEETFLKDSDPAVRTISSELYQVLTRTTTGPPKTKVMAAQSPHGLKAWNDLIRYYDPRNQSRKVAALRPIQNPTKQASTEQHFIELWRTWEQEVAKFESKYGMLEDTTKIVAITSILPGNMSEAMRAANQDFQQYSEIKEYFTEY